MRFLGIAALTLIGGFPAAAQDLPEASWRYISNSNLSAACTD